MRDARGTPGRCAGLSLVRVRSMCVRWARVTVLRAGRGVRVRCACVQSGSRWAAGVATKNS